jgi:tetratricopeptide (TPR) repeat protein
MATNFSRFAWSLSLAMVLGLQAASAQDNLEEASGTALERGAAALREENWEAAREEFTEAIATNPADPRGYIGRGQALAALDLPQDALADFKTAMDYTNRADEASKTLRAETQYQRGKMYLDMGNQFIGTAVPDLQAAVASNPNDLRYSFALGKALAIASPFSPGAGAQAEPLLTKYLEENPNDAEAYRLRGTAFASMNKVPEAMADLNKAIELDPESYENYLTLATLEITQKNFQSSVDALEKAIELYKPEEGQEDIPFIQGYITLAVVYEELGKIATDENEARAAFEKAIATADKLIELLPEDKNYDPSRAEAWRHRGIAHRFMDQYGAAVKDFSKSISYNREQGEAYFRRAICFTLMGEEELALRDLKSTQALNYEDARAYLWQGMAYAKMGDYREAIRAYNTAISFSNVYTDAYLNRAHAYFQLGEYENAIESFNECILLESENPTNFYKRALCYENLGNLEDAVQSYTTAIEFDDKYQKAYDRLIPVLEQLGRTELAEQYRAKRAELGPTAQREAAGLSAMEVRNL